MARFFINRPIFAIVISVFIVLAGVISIFQLPIAQYPQIAAPVISVRTNYTGANSDVVEQSVAQLIEQQVNGIENMISMQSTSADSGSYSLNVKFELGTDANEDSVETQNRVGQAQSQLPQEVVTSGITTRKVSPDTALYFTLVSPNNSYDSVFLKNYGSINIIEDIKRIKGVGDVMEFGTDFGMRIWLQPDKMAQLGITANDVVSAIQQQNVQAPAGSIGTRPSVPQQEFQYTARVQGRLDKPAQFAQIIVRAKPDGSFVRVGDVARVELAGKDYSFASDFNGQDSVTFGVQLASDANALETVAKVRETIDKASKKFPNDMEYKIVVDNTDFVKESLKEVLITFGEALFLVSMIVFIFLQSCRATLIPMLAVPVSLLGTFAAFVMLGFSINTLTLFAMVLAIGLVVDDAIVVVEAVEHHMRYNGLSPKEATVRAMSEVSGPVIAIAFVLCSVFLPVAFFGGTAGVLYKQFALTISISMILSALVALSLTPALCALLLKPYNPNEHTGFLGRFFDRFNQGFDRMVGRYASGIKWMIRKTGLALACLLVLIVCSGALLKILPSTFVPAEDQGFIIGIINLPEAASMNRTREVGNRIGEMVRKIPGVEDAVVVTGYDILGGANKSSSGLMIVRLKPWDERTDKSLSVESEIRKIFGVTMNMPEASVLAFNAPALPGVGVGGLTMMLQDRSGGSIENMDAVAKQFLAAARQRPEFAQVYTTFRTDTPGYQFDVDRDKTQKLGIPLKDVYSTMQAFLGGVPVNDFNSFGHTYKVMLQAEPQYRSDVDALRFFFVRSQDNQMIPLNTLVKPVPRSGTTAIKRFNGFRSVQIGANPAPGYSTGQVISALEEVAEQNLPDSFSYEWVDQARDEKISGGRAPLIFGLALLFVFLCLAALYESWSVPLAVLLAVPAGIFGALIFQYGRDLQNNVYMQIGLVMLIGLAAKNAILIVEFAKVRVDQGMNIMIAAIEACKLRIRPILMTSLAFIIGCFPLTIATGAGAGARNAMGTSVVGGMLTATIIGIFLIPVLFVVVYRIAEKIKPKKKQSEVRIAEK